ncbi:MAG: NUDIX hydrolase [Gammaproteobacteria bacterium]|jgi:ADP-ribose pyrophosphatase
MADKPIVGVGAVVIHQQRVLLVKRAQPPFTGLWCIPGGKIRFGETLQQAAEREIREETGIEIRARQPVYVFDVIDTSDKQSSCHYVVVDLEADYLSGEPNPRDDALDAAWFSKDDIDQDSVQQLTRDFLARWWINNEVILVPGDTD